jgi:glutathione S-transferase
MRILWGRDTSSNVRKVLWLLEELGLPYERRDVGGAFGGTDTPAYLAMNPTRLVPTLQEGRFTLWESNAILRYLANTHREAEAFWPADPHARANVDRWLDAQQTLLNAAQSIVFQTLIRTPPADRDMTAFAKAAIQADRAWLLLDQQLSRTQAYVAGAEMSLADFAWGVHVHRWFNMDVPRSTAPALWSWYQRLLARPLYDKYCAGPVV